MVVDSEGFTEGADSVSATSGDAEAEMSSDEEEEAKNNPKNTFEEESSVMTVSALEGRYARLKNTFHKRFRRQASD